MWVNPPKASFIDVHLGAGALHGARHVSEHPVVIGRAGAPTGFGCISFSGPSFAISTPPHVSKPHPAWVNGRI